MAGRPSQTNFVLRNRPYYDTCFAPLLKSSLLMICGLASTSLSVLPGSDATPPLCCSRGVRVRNSLLVCATQTWHTYSIRLAAHIWGEFRHWFEISMFLNSFFTFVVWCFLTGPYL